METGNFSAEEIKILKEQGLSDDFISGLERIVLTYDDWLYSKWPVIWRGQGIKVLPYTEQGKTVKTIAFVIPPLEWRKAEKKMMEVMEKFITTYSDSLISYFEERYSGSLEKKLLIQDELKKVESLLFDPNWTDTYSTYGKPLWLTFRNDIHQRDSKISHWYKMYCVDGRNGLDVIAPMDVLRTVEEVAREKGSTHFAVAAFAFHRFKKYLNDKLEFETPIELTLEDWELCTENWKDIELNPSKNPINQPFEERPARRKDGQFRKYSLPDAEYKKIATARNDIFEKLVALFLRGQIEDFEQRYSASLEKNTLLEMELQNVNAWLSDKTLSSTYVFPNPTGGSAIFGDFGGLARDDGEDPNTFPYWYNKLIVQGKDARAFVEPGHDNAKSINYPISVHVLYQYRQFLESRKNVSTKQLIEKGELAKKVPSKTLAMYCFYRESKNEYPELEGMTRKEVAEKIVLEHGLSPSHFRQDLSAMKKKDNRLVPENIPRILHVIEMLADCPKSLQYAQDELKILQVRN